jgi:hypothetical protein
MQRQTKPRMRCPALRGQVPHLRHTKRPRLLLVTAALVMIAMMLSACGGSAASGGSQPSGTLPGNWQFTVFQNPDPNYPAGQIYGLQGGFLLQTNGSFTGQAVYSVSNLSSEQVAQVCNAGSATISEATVGGQTVLTAVAGSQTYVLTIAQSSNTSISGTYTATQGTASDGSVCGIGTGESGPQNWQANLVPPLTGPITGTFHSTSGNSGLNDQDFAVSGALTQGQNIGASSATVTGALNFTGYPCLSTASVTGQISGSSVLLQLIATNGSTVGLIGQPLASANTGVNPVTFDSVQGGYILHGLQPTYMVLTSSCPGSGLSSTTSAGDSGAICLALNSTTTCQQPITLSPAALTFPAQMLVDCGTQPNCSSPVQGATTSQTITLTNNSNSTLSGLQVTKQDGNSSPFGGYSDFTGLPSFIETDACGPGGAFSNGQPFDLTSGQSCAITVTFTPQESCPWLPFGNPPSPGGAAPEHCPLPIQNYYVQVSVPDDSNPDGVKAFAASASGVGLSAIQPSTPELDFSAENQSNPAEASPPQSLSFTNYSANPVPILGPAPCTNPYQNGKPVPLKFPRPLTESSPVAGLQVLGSSPGTPFSISPDGTTIEYSCDSDPGTVLPNFQISLDTCTGTLLAPQASCTLQLTYAPQPNTDQNSGLDYFLQLNTVQCYGAVTTGCEIDSGRFPVELKANQPSPLRMSPSAGLDFGSLKKGSTSSPLTVNLLNDPTLGSPLTVTFVGRISTQGNYVETDDCPAILAPGASCTLSVAFTPTGTGFESGLLTIDYTQQSSGGVVTTGNPQFVYLRGTGQ